MKILRYAYPSWPGQYDGLTHETEFGTFDFYLQDVIDVLVANLQEQEKGLHLNASWRAAHATTLKLLHWAQQQIDSVEEIITWHHPSRDLPVEQLQKEYREWSTSHSKMMKTDLQTPVTQPRYFEDSFFGSDLAKLIYTQNFFLVSVQNVRSLTHRKFVAYRNGYTRAPEDKGYIALKTTLCTRAKLWSFSPVFSLYLNKSNKE